MPSFLIFNFSYLFSNRQFKAFCRPFLLFTHLFILRILSILLVLLKGLDLSVIKRKSTNVLDL